MKIRVFKEVTKIADLFEELKLEENSVYIVQVSMRSTNPKHEAFLFTGFKNGNYCEVYNNNYENPVKLQDVYSISIVKKLYTKKK